jgi:hypothetical protein
MIQQHHSLGIYKRSKISMLKPIFTEALFTTTKKWKQPKCPTYTMEYYSVIKKSKILLSTTWMKVEVTM